MRFSPSKSNKMQKTPVGETSLTGVRLKPHFVMSRTSRLWLSSRRQRNNQAAKAHLQVRTQQRLRLT
jgi:hypothetical protein